jgi:hypothetical protein
LDGIGKNCEEIRLGWDLNPLNPHGLRANRTSPKKAMRALQTINENDGISRQTLDDYAKLFKQPLPIVMYSFLLLFLGGPFQTI